MRLLTKFSLVYALVFGIGLAATGSIFNGQLQRSAREQVLHKIVVVLDSFNAHKENTQKCRTQKQPD